MATRLWGECKRLIEMKYNHKLLEEDLGRRFKKEDDKKSSSFFNIKESAK